MAVALVEGNLDQWHLSMYVMGAMASGGPKLNKEHHSTVTTLPIILWNAVTQWSIPNPAGCWDRESSPGARHNFMVLELGVGPREAIRLVSTLALSLVDWRAPNKPALAVCDKGHHGWAAWGQDLSS